MESKRVLNSIRLVAIAICISFFLLSSVSAGEVSCEKITLAISKSLPLLQKSATTYTEQRSCFTCHHQALPAMTISLARSRGFSVDDKGARAQSEFTHRYFTDRKSTVSEGSSVPGGPYTAGYALLSLAADRWEADETIDALVEYLNKTQSKDGSWQIRTHRPPLEDSHFTATAVSLRGLQKYAPKDQAEQVSKRIENARNWLVTAKPKSNEDKVFRLFGLKWSGAEESAIDKAVKELIADQRDDGGWGQLTDMTSDSYATGQALVALHQAGGLAISDRVFQNGVAFFLKTQRDDGSWLVKTRSKPIQKYFESGFPHEKSQFISICGTCWATMALVLASGDEKSSEDAANVKLFKWERGIGVRSRDDSSKAMHLWFYEWNMFEAMSPGQHTHGKFPLPREVDKSETHATIDAPELKLKMTACKDGVDLLLTVINRTDRAWPEIAGIIPCFNPGPRDDRCEQFVNNDTYFLGGNGLEKLVKREIHFNDDVRRQVDEQAKDGKFVFSDKWPTSDVNATAGILVRQSNDKKWVTAIAWESFLSSQGHNPWDCMHLCVRVGPLKPGESKQIRGKMYLFPGTKDDCLKRFQREFSKVTKESIE